MIVKDSSTPSVRGLRWAHSKSFSDGSREPERLGGTPEYIRQWARFELKIHVGSEDPLSALGL